MTITLNPRGAGNILFIPKTTNQRREAWGILRHLVGEPAQGCSPNRADALG